MKILPIILLSTTVFAAPKFSDVSSECAVCHFAVQIFSRAKGAPDVQSAIDKNCLKLSRCPTTLTHCEIIEQLSKIQLGRNVSTMSSVEGKFNFHLNKIHDQCAQNPHMNIFDAGQPGAAECTICFLIYYFFQYISTAVLEMPLLGQLTQVIDLTCLVVSGVYKFQPAICLAMLGPASLPAIIQGIQDSLGSFYWLIGQQGFGCPTYQQLFSIC